MVKMVRCFLIVLVTMLSLPFVRAADELVYVGGYTRSTGKGIYAFRFNAATAKLTPVGLVAETVNPTFLAVHPNHLFLYALNEIKEFRGQPTGAVSAFVIDPQTGKLTLLDQVSTRSPGPTHLALDKTAKNLLVANYTGGSVAVLPLKADGNLGEVSSFVQHTGSSVNPTRQQSPHAHAIQMTPDNRFALVPDLGVDKIFIYRFDPDKGALSPSDPPFVAITPGAGPRHLALHPNKRFIYLIRELDSSVTAFSLDGKHGRLKEIETVSTLPKDFAGKSTAAEVAVHPSGRFLYGSNRGHDSIAVFSINRSGKLTLVESVPTQGKVPRNFAIDPSGAYLFAANQNSSNLVVFRIDPKTGRLTPTGQSVEVPDPSCVVFVAETSLSAHPW